MTELSFKTRGYLFAFIAIGVIGFFLIKYEQRDHRNRIQYLNSYIANLEKSFVGVYSGKAFSNSSIPDAGIYPEYFNIRFEILSFISVINLKDSDFYKNRSNIFDTDQDHIEGIYKTLWISESGEKMIDSGRLYYYPKQDKYCIPSSSQSSLFGGDICDIILTNKFLQVTGGHMKCILYKG